MKGDHESGIGVGGRGLARENQSRVDQIIEKKNVNNSLPLDGDLSSRK